jgi:hypothetical protein
MAGIGCIQGKKSQSHYFYGTPASSGGTQVVKTGYYCMEAIRGSCRKRIISPPQLPALAISLLTFLFIQGLKNPEHDVVGSTANFMFVCLKIVINGLL